MRWVRWWRLVWSRWQEKIEALDLRNASRLQQQVGRNIGYRLVGEVSSLVVDRRSVD